MRSPSMDRSSKLRPEIARRDTPRSRGSPPTWTAVTDLAETFRGKRFDAPNDLIVKRDGSIWFTDPSFSQVTAYGSALHFNGVYRLDPKTKAVTLLTKALDGPNGIAFSPDEKTLYVTNASAPAVTGLLSFPITADGTLGPSRRLDYSGCDGIGVDEKRRYLVDNLRRRRRHHEPGRQMDRRDHIPRDHQQRCLGRRGRQDPVRHDG